MLHRDAIGTLVAIDLASATIRMMRDRTNVYAVMARAMWYVRLRQVESDHTC
jgi:hypothetical protein